MVDVASYDTLDLRYPDGAHDAEVLLVDPITLDLFVVTKENDQAGVYRATSARMSTAQSTIELEYIATLAFDVASGGDIAPDGSEIIIRNEDLAQVWWRSPGQTIVDAMSTAAYLAPVIGRPTEPNGEAIAYRADNSGYFTVSEGAFHPAK